MSNLALVGNPNCGKSTVFNALTGLNQRVGNYAGVTVERRSGRIHFRNGQHADIIDLPGTYSICARSPDEAIVSDILKGQLQGESKLTGVICIVDASNLERHLYLVTQVIDLGLPMILVLNMMDEARNAGKKIDIEQLSKSIGCKVFPVIAQKKQGIEPLIKAIYQEDFMVPQRRWQSPPQARYAWIKEILALGVKDTYQARKRFSHQLDKILIHPVLGWMGFVLLMAVMFYAIFSLAAYPMDLIDQGFTQLTAWSQAHLPAGLLTDLITGGVLPGIGGVVIFLPQILILFLFLGLLQDTGYMARAAYIMDRVMSKVGLHGKSFIPLLSSFACAIPGIMATRTIENPRDRLLTILVAPLISCSARLPVYLILVAVMMPQAPAWQKSGMMLLMYLIGIVASCLMAWILKKTFFKKDRAVFMMELPPYRMPSFNLIVRQMFERAFLFLSRAGTIILALSILLWAAMTFPKQEGLNAADALKHSYAGQMGQAIEPVIKPLGYDWRIGIGLIGSLAAREVFVSTMGIAFNLENSDNQDTLQQAFQQAVWPDGRPLFTPLVCLNLMVFYVFAMQCLSTLVVVYKETLSWRWTLFQFVYMSSLAYLFAFLVIHLGRLMGFH